MVEDRLDNDVNFYNTDLNYVSDAESDSNQPTVTETQMQAEQVDLDQQKQLLSELRMHNVEADDIDLRIARCWQQYFTVSVLAASKQYCALYNKAAYLCFKKALMDAVYNNYLAYVA